VTELLSMFVVSDLHCIGPSEVDNRSDSLLHLPASAGLLRTPFNALLRLVEDQAISADVLLCCGDLTNRSAAEGFELGWAELEALASALDATSILFTPGNHDVDVYDLNGVADPYSTIAAAKRSPDRIAKPSTSHCLLVDGFEIYGADQYRIVNVDTNGRDPVARRGKTGHLDLETIDALEAQLGRMSSVDCYLLICHHHPHRHGDIDADDYSEFANAPELFAMIDRLPDAAWYMVHGHKHYPRIGVVNSTTTVFSAGSFSGSFYGPQQGVARNQCYSLRLVRDASLGTAHPPVIEFRAWDWAAVRWIPALDGFNIPRFGGFGARVVTNQYAGRIASHVKASSGQRCSGSELARKFPELRYLPPQDILRCVNTLESTHDIEVLISKQTGEWRELGLRAS